MKANSGLKKNRTKIQMVLTALVILSVVRQFFLGNYHNMFLGILTLILFMVPQFLDRKLNVTIPPGLETVILIFIFSAEILGEINAFYVKIPIWDTILHTTNGFLMAAIGFALIDLFNRSDRFSIKMSPYFVAFFAFCFSMTVGVMWEFFEFSMDWFFGMDMQKDWIVPAINSVKLNPTGANVPIHVDVQSLAVNGETWNLGGYLDIGIVDTMKDLIVNFIGYRYSVSAKPRKRKAGSFSDPAGTQQAGRRTFFQRSVRSTATETGALFWKYSPALLWKAQEVFPADP